jgi:DNA primase catalytic subunit
MIKSGVSWFRKNLKLRGKTEHSGRGFYIMDVENDVEIAMIKDAVENLIARHSDKVNVSRDEKYLRVAIRAELISDKWYRTLVFCPGSCWPLVVTMSFPDELKAG